MDYETIDSIADSYIPFLAIVFFVGLAGRAVKRPTDRNFLVRVFVFFAGLLLVSYGIMFLDNAIHVWHSLNLDYSTHTAVSLTLIMSICVLARQFRRVVISSFVLYVLLMLYQKYHTVLDIASTMVPLVFSALVLLRLLSLQAKDQYSGQN
jgi:hypothetical protein